MSRTESMNYAYLKRTTAIILLVEAFLMFLPLYILGTSLDWPASLDQPASVNLPLILEEYNSMFLGYSLYLIYSILFWPVAYLTGRIVVEHNTSNPIFQLANGFAVMSVLARCLGIVRWLFAMPILAQVYTTVDVSVETKANIDVIYEMLNAYAGGIGELLGVSLFAAIWLILVNILVLRNPSLPKWLGYLGFLTAAVFMFNLLDLVGINTWEMPTISVSLLHFWMLFMAIILIRAKK